MGTTGADPGTLDPGALDTHIFSDQPDLAVDKQARRRWFRIQQRDRTYRRLLVLADAAAAAGAAFVATLTAGSSDSYVALFAAIPLIVIMSRTIGTYNREDLLVRKSTLDEAPALFQLATFYVLAVWLADDLLTKRTAGRWQLVVLWAALLLLLLMFRGAAREFARRTTPPEKCLVIGDEATCHWMQVKLARRRGLHAVVVARVIPAFERKADGEFETRVDIHQVQALATSLGIDRIIITPGGADEDAVLNVVHTATSLGLKVSVLPRVLQLIGSSSEFDDVEGVPLLSVRPLGLRPSSRFVKRCLDVLGSSLGLLVLSPLLIGVAIAIKFDSKGPLLFRQIRVGRDARPFEMLKFRTMVRDADEQKPTLLHLNQADGLFKIEKDPRLTRFGRLLRRVSIDELPQLLNVLRGEMSLVGPRPLIADEDVRLEGWRRRRVHLTPGMTGHWQILGSSRIPLEDMAQIDYLYVSNWSLWLDVKILLRTVPYVLAGRGQ